MDSHFGGFLGSYHFLGGEMLIWLKVVLEICFGYNGGVITKIHHVCHNKNRNIMIKLIKLITKIKSIL